MSTHHKIMKITFAIVCYTLSCFASEETLNPPSDEFDEAIGMGVLIGRATYCKAPEEKLELAGESVLRWIILQTKDDKTTTHKDNLRKVYNKSLTYSFDPNFDEPSYSTCKKTLLLSHSNDRFA